MQTRLDVFSQVGGLTGVTYGDDDWLNDEYLSPKCQTAYEQAIVYLEGSANLLLDGRILIIMRDVTVRKQNESILHDYQRRLKSMASELALSEERERRRLAVNLHDRIGQALEPEGALVIGSTESITGFCPQFVSKRYLRSVYYQVASGPA